jgi:hypothetical protein
VRDFCKLLIVGIVFFCASVVHAESYKVLVIPDNIVTENVAADSYIYNASAEFFADEVVTILNNTDYINSPSVSDTRSVIKKEPASVLVAKSLTTRFKNSYNIDFPAVKKLAQKSNSRYVLLITSYIDAENYIMRRTFWDFLNIPGATVVDPAYKISTYAVLVDTSNNTKLWADTYYKTISSCENRIITRGPSPQTEQLSKIKDYSRYLCPQIAQNVQINVLPPSVYEKETKQVYYDMGNIDNVFTKKYRHLGKEYNKVYAQKKESFEEFRDDTKQKIQDANDKRKQKAAERAQQKLEQSQSKLEVKATPIFDDDESGINNISNKVKTKTNDIKNAVLRTSEPETIEPIDIKKSRRNTLYGNYDSNRPELRDYN